MIDRVLAPQEEFSLEPVMVDNAFLLSLVRFFTPIHTIHFWAQRIPFMIFGEIWRSWFVYPKEGEETDASEEEVEEE